MSLAMAFWTLWTMRFGCFLFSAGSRLIAADLIRQEKNIPEDTDDDWQRRCGQLSAEHKHADARTQLIQGWKQWVGQESLAERRATANAHAPAAAPEEVP